MGLFSKTYHSEKSLVKDCRKGKRSAQQALYERYSPKMLSICIRYVGNRFEAEDVLVTAFMKVFDKIDTFRDEGSFEGWVRRIVVNEALGYIRKKGKVYHEEIEKADFEGHHHDMKGTLEADDLMQLVTSLPEGYRAVFSLYAIEGYGHKEIAKKLGISEGTSKSQLSRARTMLKRMLAQQEGNTEQVFR